MIKNGKLSQQDSFNNHQFTQLCLQLFNLNWPGYYNYNYDYKWITQSFLLSSINCFPSTMIWNLILYFEMRLTHKLPSGYVDITRFLGTVLTIPVCLWLYRLETNNTKISIGINIWRLQKKYYGNCNISNYFVGLPLFFIQFITNWVCIFTISNVFEKVDEKVLLKTWYNDEKIQCFNIKTLFSHMLQWTPVICATILGSMITYPMDTIYHRQMITNESIMTAFKNQITTDNDVVDDDKHDNYNYNNKWLSLYDGFKYTALRIGFKVVLLDMLISLTPFLQDVWYTKSHLLQNINYVVTCVQENSPSYKKQLIIDGYFRQIVLDQYNIDIPNVLIVYVEDYYFIQSRSKRRNMRELIDQLLHIKCQILKRYVVLKSSKLCKDYCVIEELVYNFFYAE